MGRKTNAAVTAGLLAALTLGQVPTQALAANLAPQAGENTTGANAASNTGAASAGSAASTAAEPVAVSEGQKAGAATPAPQAAAQGQGKAGTDASGAAAGDAKQAATVKSVANPQDVTAPAGASASLPATVQAVMSDGTTKDVAVTWHVDGQDDQAAQDTQNKQLDVSKLPAGTYTVKGAIKDSDQVPEFKLVLTDAAQENAAQPDAAQSGDAAKAESATAADSQSAGTPAAQSAPAANAAASSDADGEVTVDGVKYTYAQPVANVGVGFTKEAVNSQLGSVTFTNTADDSKLNTWVEWDTSKVDLSKAGTYQITGKANFYTGSYATVKATVNVKKIARVSSPSVAVATGQLNDYDITGSQISVTVFLDDGTSFNAYVDWNQKQVQDVLAKKDTPGTYKVDGTLKDNPSYKVTCTVRILEVNSVEAQSTTTLPGVAPTLPSTVYVTLENGQSAWLNVTWDKIDPAQYAKQNVFEVMGTVAGTSVRAKATVYVSSYKKGNYSVSKKTVVGKALDASQIGGVSVDYELGYGSEWMMPEWNVPAANDPIWSKAGTFDITGKIPGTDMTATAHITVLGKDSFQTEYDVKSVAGIRSNLPYNAALKDGYTYDSDLHISWDRPGYSPEFNKVGAQFDVKGKIDGSDIEVVAHVTVVGVKSVNALPDVTTTQEVVPQLNDYASVTYTDGTTGTESVSWTLPKASELIATDEDTVVEVKGKLGNGMEVSVKVHIAWIRQNKAKLTVSTAPGIAPDLPSTVSVPQSDGSVSDQRVDWETPNYADYAAAGKTFTVLGHIRGSRYPVEALVSVRPVASGTEVSLSTAPGFAPELSSRVNRVTLDDGTSINLPNDRILWNAIDPSAYAAAGAVFDVSGSVVGTGIQLKAHVSVLGVKDVSFSYGSKDNPDIYYIGTDAKLQLSSYIGAELENGEYISVPVTWGDVPEAVYTTPDTYEIKGKAAGKDVSYFVRSLKVKSVRVDEPTTTVSGVNPGPLSTYNAKLIVETKDGKTEEVAGSPYHVTWDMANLDYKTPGDHTVKGTAVFTINVPGGTKTISVPATGTLRVYPGISAQDDVNVWTLPGDAPMLPQSISFNYSDSSAVSALVNLLGLGSKSLDYDAPMGSAKVKWDAIDASRYAKDQDGKTFTVEGVIDGTSIKVKATVTVASIKSTTAIPTVQVVAGSIFAGLPSSVTATLSNGEKQELFINWSKYPEYEDLKNAGVSIPVTGSYTLPNGTKLPVSTTVNVLAATKLLDEKDWNNVLDITVKAGSKQVVLPSSLPVRLSDGSIAPGEVRWDRGAFDAANAEKLSKAGTIKVTGTVTGVDVASTRALAADGKDGATVTATVHVIDTNEKDFVTAVEPTYLTLPEGSTADDLPKTVYGYTNQFDAGGDAGYAGEELDVAWDTSGVDFSKPGSYVVYGTLSGSDLLNAPSAGKAAQSLFAAKASGFRAVAYLNVSKKAASVKSVEPVKITVPAGISKEDAANQLPDRVKVNYDDGTSKQQQVNWVFKTLTDKKLAQEGNTITVEGNIEGVAQKAKAIFTVGSKDTATYTGLAENGTFTLTAQEGVNGPKLPETVKVKKSDGSMVDSKINWDAVSASSWAWGTGGKTFAVVGDTVLGGFPVTAMVTVQKTELKLEKISVTKKPTKLEYTVGDTFDAAGLEVTKTLNDGTSSVADPSEYTVSAPDMATPGTKTVTVKLGDKTASFDITVKAKDQEKPTPTVTVTGISVSKQPAKTVYTQGDTFDAAGLEVTKTLSDGKTQVADASEYVVTGFNANEPGTQTLTVTLKGDSSKTATFTVTVNKKDAGGETKPYVKGIEVSLTKDIYTAGGTFDASTVKVTKVMSDGTKVEAKAGEFGITAPDLSKAGTVTGSVELLDANGKVVVSKEFTVTVKAKDTGNGGETTTTPGKPGTDNNNGSNGGSDNNGGTGNDHGSGNGGSNNNGGSNSGNTDNGGSENGNTDNNGSGSTDNNDKGAGDTDKGSKNDKKPASTNAKGKKADANKKPALPQTADFSTAAVAATGATGIAALVGAWFARRRNKHEE